MADQDVKDQLETPELLTYDPYDVAIAADPYPTFKRLRDEAPLYYNQEYDFFAASRYDDVEHGLKDRDTFISGRGGILELIKSGIEIPAGTVIFEDPPTHTIHRSVLSRMFTPRKVAALEPQVRRFCQEALDPLVGSSGFDLVNDFGTQLSGRVIGMLMGIPESDQQAVRDRVDARLRTEAGKPMEHSENFTEGDSYADYVEWRAKHPSDDVMTEMLNAEFEDENGTQRRLTRDELLTYIAVVAGAGNETTARLVGWMGKTLADHPDQRREIVEDRFLVGDAVEEVLRFEPPGPAVARYVARDAEIQGQTVPEGSAILFLVGSANRDDRRFADGDRFDIHRQAISHVTFGFGAHFCLGAALARLEGRIALDELVARFPEWHVDLDNAKLASTSTVRGYEALPLVLP
jgi:cytochrome P450